MQLTWRESQLARCARFSHSKKEPRISFLAGSLRRNRHSPYSEKVTDTAGGDLDMGGSGLRAHGQGDDLLANTLSFREIGVFEAKIAVFPHRFGPVDKRLHALFLQVLAELFALLCSNHIVLITVEVFVA